MNLPVLAVASFFLASCTTSASRTYTSVEPERKCQIWMNYHSEFVSGIKGAQNASELFSKEQEAREVRIGFADEIKHSDMSPYSCDIWMQKVEISKGQAIIAATQREEELIKSMLAKIDALCQESSRLSLLFISQNDNSMLNDVLQKMSNVSRQLEDIHSECALLGIEKDFQQACDKLTADLVEIMRASQQRLKTAVDFQFLPLRAFFFFFMI